MRDGELMVVRLDPSRRTDSWYVYDYFDGTLEADLRRYPAADDLAALMHKAGFVRSRIEEADRLAVRLDARRALAEGQLARSATSQLTMLSDEEYERGLLRIRDDIEAAERRGEIHELLADLRLWATTGTAP